MNTRGSLLLSLVIVATANFFLFSSSQQASREATCIKKGGLLAIGDTLPPLPAGCRTVRLVDSILYCTVRGSHAILRRPLTHERAETIAVLPQGSSPTGLALRGDQLAVTDPSSRSLWITLNGSLEQIKPGIKHAITPSTVLWKDSENLIFHGMWLRSAEDGIVVDQGIIQFNRKNESIRFLFTLKGEKSLGSLTRTAVPMICAVEDRILAAWCADSMLTVLDVTDTPAQPVHELNCADILGDLFSDSLAVLSFASASDGAFRLQLTRTSHQPSTTTADMALPASLRSVGRPRRISEDTSSAGLDRKPCGQCPLGHFATKAGEKSGLNSGGRSVLLQGTLGTPLVRIDLPPALNGHHLLACDDLLLAWRPHDGMLLSLVN